MEKLREGPFYERSIQSVRGKTPLTRVKEALAQILINAPSSEPLKTIEAGTGESWLDFRYRGEEFSLHNPYGANEFWFFCTNPECDKAILSNLSADFEDELKRQEMK